MSDFHPDENPPTDPFESAPEPDQTEPDPAAEKPKPKTERKPRPVRAAKAPQVDQKTARAVLSLVRDLDRLSRTDRELMAVLYRTDPTVDDLIVAVVTGVEPATQHLTDVVTIAGTDDPLEAMVTVQTWADGSPERFRAAWSALADVDAELPRAARPGPKAAADFVRAAKRLDKAALKRLTDQLALVR